MSSPARATTHAPLTTLSSSLSSTAYCDTGTTASGAQASYGGVAGNYWPLGTHLWVSSSPTGGHEFAVTDRIGYGSQLDFALPGDCSSANAWGRRTIYVRRI